MERVKMSRRNIIRINDRVKITNPEIVLRVGYPLSKQTIIDTFITQEQKDSIYTIIRLFGGTTTTVGQPLFNIDKSTYEDETYYKILDMLSYMILKNNKYGGKERKLHTINRESLRNKFGRVIERKVVKTGTYRSGYSYNDEDYDYDPPYLENEKTHVLYKIELDYGQDDVCPNINEDGGVWIEKINLEKIDTPTH